MKCYSLNILQSLLRGFENKVKAHYRSRERPHSQTPDSLQIHFPSLYALHWLHLPYHTIYRYHTLLHLYEPIILFGSPPHSQLCSPILFQLPHLS